MIINNAIESVPLRLLKPHPRNVNQGDFGAILESVETNGFYGTIVASKRTGYIVAGNHRFAVAKHLGMDSVPVAWVDVDAEQELRILMADNRTTRLGMDNEADLATLLSELASTEIGLRGTGYDGDDLDRMIGELSRAWDQEVMDDAEQMGEDGSGAIERIIVKCPRENVSAVRAAIADALINHDGVTIA